MPFAAPDLPQTEAVIIEMTNAFRAENKLATIAPNAALREAAQAYANYLATTGTFAHTADGREPAERARAAGYTYCMVAENLALNQTNRGFETRELAERTVEGWKNSPPHRAAMLQPHLTEIGVGIAKAADVNPKFLTVQLFGRPETLKYELHIENRSGTGIKYTLGDQKNSIADRTHVKHTSCVPNDLVFNIGRITSKFEARDGASYILTRAPDGTPRVDLQRPQATAAPGSAPLPVPIKTTKSQR